MRLNANMLTKKSKVFSTLMAFLLLVPGFSLMNCRSSPFDPGGHGTTGHTHVWGPWIVTTPPTATQNGVETRTCTLDSRHKETRSVPPTDSGGDVGTPGLAYELNATATAYSVSKGTVTSGAVVIPATNNGLPVNAIIESGFAYLRAVTSITIPSSVTFIGNNAFSGTGLTSITIPSSVTSISESMFSYCESLSNITIPSSVTSIGLAAFNSCTALASITIPSSVTTIGQAAFQGCKSLSSVIIPSRVTSIGGYAFNGCTSLVSFNIPASVTFIGQSAFADCTGIPSIIIPSTVQQIGFEAFWNWIASQTIYIEGHISPAVADSAWGSRWRYNCSAAIKYWSGSAWL